MLIASDSAQLTAQLKSVFPETDYNVSVVTSGKEVRNAAQLTKPDLVILDFQIGSMGGMAICMDLRLEYSGARLPFIPVLLLLDRRADVFLARRAGAHGFLVKPLDPIRIRKASQALLDGGTYEDDSFKPNPVVVS